jgi:MFS transporter, DHA3 family, macrolide efflux protein
MRTQVQAGVTPVTKDSGAPHEPDRLLNRNFLLLWQGQLVSQFGNHAYQIAMMLWLMHATGSASIMGLIMMVSSLPGILFGPIAGTFVDRHSRRSIIIFSDIGQGLVVLAAAALLFFRGEATQVIVLALFVVAATAGVLNAAFVPAISASIPDLVPSTRVASANSMNEFSRQAASLTGRALGGLLFGWLGAPMLFLLNGLSFLFSAGTAAFIRIPQRLPERSRTLGASMRTYGRETMAGLRYVWDWSAMRAFLLLLAGFNFVVMPMFVLLPFFVTDVLRRDPSWYGFMLAGLSAGSLGGLSLAGVAKWTGSTRSGVLLFALALAGAVPGALAAVRAPVAAVALCFAFGAAAALINVFAVTIVQVITPGPMRGRVTSLQLAISMGAVPLGAGLGGILGDLTSRNIPLIYGLCGACALSFTLAASASPAFREFLSSEHSKGAAAVSA